MRNFRIYVLFASFPRFDIMWSTCSDWTTWYYNMDLKSWKAWELKHKFWKFWLTNERRHPVILQDSGAFDGIGDAPSESWVERNPKERIIELRFWETRLRMPGWRLSPLTLPFDSHLPSSSGSHWGEKLRVLIFIHVSTRTVRLCLPATQDRSRCLTSGVERRHHPPSHQQVTAWEWDLKQMKDTTATRL